MFFENCFSNKHFTCCSHFLSLPLLKALGCFLDGLKLWNKHCDTLHYQYFCTSLTLAYLLKHTDANVIFLGILRTVSPPRHLFDPKLGITQQHAVSIRVEQQRPVCSNLTTRRFSLPPDFIDSCCPRTEHLRSFMTSLASLFVNVCKLKAACSADDSLLHQRTTGSQLLAERNIKNTWIIFYKPVVSKF